jgi:HTH-type transcriptional regulator/antitoxin HigA
MIKKGWIQKPGNNAEILSCVKKIWGTNSFEDILMEINSKPLPAFRKSERDGFSRNYSQTWLKIAENISDTIKAPKYNPVLFEGICARANEYTIKENGETEFIKDINKAGVKFFILPHLRKTFIDGAAFVHKNNPVIVYTARHDRMDNFWFTVLHEAGHVLKHLKVGSEGFIDDISIIEGEKEKEADRFSGKQLKINEILKMYEESFNGRVTWITAVSKELHISSAVIVGFLQKAGKLTYRSKVLSSIKNPISELFKKNYVADIPAICKFN